MVTQLQVILGKDNDARKAAEEHLKKIKDGEPAKYAVYNTAIIVDTTVPQEIRSLASVILRRSLGTCLTDQKETLWEKLEDVHRNLLKVNLLESIKTITVKDMMHK